MDGRNTYESAIGQFKGAIKPDVRTAKEFAAALESSEMQAIKDQPIVTYCTGGIRCEILTSMMKKRGFTDVYQMDGGVVKYGEKYGDEGLWEGKLFIFDDRMQIGFSDKAVDIADCEVCGTKTSRQVNSTNLRRRLHIVCESCSLESAVASSK